MKNVTRERAGELFILSKTFLWASFPVVTILSYAILPSLASLGWSTLFSAIFFGAIVLYRKTWKEMTNPLLWRYTFFIVLFIGILYYALYYFGLESTTPGNASIIALFQVFTTFYLFNVFRKESISREHAVGALLMVAGAAILLIPNYAGARIGDFLILAATFSAPIGNVYQQKARRIASAETILFLRALCSTPFIFLMMHFTGAEASLGDIEAALPFLLISGFLLLGLEKILWIEGIHRISVTKAEALGSFAPLLTLIYAWILLGQHPSVFQLVSLAPLLIGVLLLTDQLSFKMRTRT